MQTHINLLILTQQGTVWVWELNIQQLRYCINKVHTHTRPTAVCLVLICILSNELLVEFLSHSADWRGGERHMQTDRSQERQKEKVAQTEINCDGVKNENSVVTN